MSHNSPSQPLEQKHLNESTSSMHVPPFLQGFPRQSLMSMTKSQQLLLKTFFIHKSKLGWVIARHFLRKTRYSPFLHAQEQLIASVFKPGKNSTCVLSLTCIKTNRSIKFPLEKNIQKYLSSRYRHVCIETGLRSVFTHRGKHEPLQKTVFFFLPEEIGLEAIHWKRHSATLKILTFYFML